MDPPAETAVIESPPPAATADVQRQRSEDDSEVTSIDVEEPRAAQPVQPRDAVEDTAQAHKALIQLLRTISNAINDTVEKTLGHTTAATKETVEAQCQNFMMSTERCVELALDANKMQGKVMDRIFEEFDRTTDCPSAASLARARQLEDMSRKLALDLEVDHQRLQRASQETMKRIRAVHDEACDRIYNDAKASHRQLEATLDAI